MFGLGLYIYAGEDLPEELDENEGEGNKVQPIKKPIQNTHKTPPKSNDNPKVVETITRSELAQKYGVENPEKIILWLENKMGKEISNFTEEETAWARQQLEAGKKKRDEEKRQSRLQRFDDEDIPFPMGDK
jgi:hypothetical protein